VCRLLAVTSAAPFAVAAHLRPFAEVARNSREYQGHGWGCTWQDGGAWRAHHSIRPIWEDDLTAFGEARVLMVHARSAFRDEDIVVENNMPFLDGRLAFAFNGELRGVRIAEQGRIGAEKLFRFLVRTGGAESLEGLRRSVQLVERRSRYVRAMNLVIGRPGGFLLCTTFNEDADYFTLHVKQQDGAAVICSRPHGAEAGWRALPNNTIEAIPWFS
jgi:glutamine amidotransferase